MCKIIESKLERRTAAVVHVLENLFNDTSRLDNDAYATLTAPHVDINTGKARTAMLAIHMLTDFTSSWIENVSASVKCEGTDSEDALSTQLNLHDIACDILQWESNKGTIDKIEKCISTNKVLHKYSGEFAYLAFTSHFMGKANLSRGIPTFAKRTREAINENREDDILESNSQNIEIQESTAAQRTRDLAGWNDSMDWITAILESNTSLGSLSTSSNFLDSIEVIQLSLNEVLYLYLIVQNAWNKISDCMISSSKSFSKLHIDVLLPNSLKSDIPVKATPRTLWKAVTNLDSWRELMIKFRVYCHYRLLGWTVKDGVKYGTDFVLYSNGPGRGHASHAVLILPQTMTSKRYDARSKLSDRWTWAQVLGVNRVCVQVNKKLLLCRIDFQAQDEKALETFWHDVEICPSKLFDENSLKVTDTLLHRWKPL